MRSLFSIPAARIARWKSRDRSGRGCLISFGLMTSPRRVMRRLARATGDYAFWLDADDLIEPPERAKLEELLGRLGRGGEMPAFVVRCSCDAGPNGEGGETVVDHIRLFPVIEGVRWTYRVHEQILPALKRAGLPVQWTDITVRHTGYADRDLRSRKLERDSRILLEELAERPDDPFTLFNLGSIAIERTEWNDALEYLKRSLRARHRRIRSPGSCLP